MDGGRKKESCFREEFASFGYTIDGLTFFYHNLEKEAATVLREDDA